MGNSNYYDHSHVTVTVNNAKKGSMALVLTTTFLIVEVVAGFLTQSLAVLSDAAHMFTDVAALAIVLIAIKVGQKPAENKRTCGYQRFEILAALFDTLCRGDLYFIGSHQRLNDPADIQSLGVMVVAILGLITNLISMKIMVSSSQEHLNIKGAYLEVLSDALGSVGGIIGAGVIYFTAWMRVDTMIAVLIGFCHVPGFYSNKVSIFCLRVCRTK